MKLFNSIQIRKPKKNKFDLSHERKFSCSMTGIYPILVQDILPGDSVRCNSEVFMRFAPMLAPIMHRVNVYTHYFFVPNRILWDDWEEFITGGKDGLSAPIHPYMNYNETNKSRFVKKLLPDYMGIPVNDGTTAITSSTKISALPFRAYTQIYNDYYRDQNLIDEVEFSKASGAITVGAELNRIMALRKRAWSKDYLTSCLPNSQKGPEVVIPLSGETGYQTPALGVQANGGFGLAGNVALANGAFNDSAGNPIRIENLASDTGIDVNDLRRSVRLQEWLEKNMRGGSRYIEQLLVHWGVIGDDARLQRSEYIGGGKSPVSISEVLNSVGQVNEAGTSTIGPPQGSMAGHGISASGRNGFKRTFKEHGYVIGLMSVLPVTAYEEGLERHWSRFDKLEYPWPEFAQLGEQAVKQKEAKLNLYTDTDGSINEGDFGYQSRFAECKFKNSSVHGDMRDNLDYWHLGRKFSGDPALNQTFIEANPDTRIFAVQDAEEDNLYVQLYNNMSAFRPLPYYGTPTL